MLATITFLIVISILVFVHELGHFVAARVFGVGVQSFAIGFKPTLWSKKVGKTTYKMNAIPMGGYVSLVGEIGDDEEHFPGFAKHEYMTHKPWWQKLCILSAGVVMNFAFAALVLIILSISLHGLSGLVSGWELYMKLTGEIVIAIGHFFSGLFSGTGLGDVSGPIGIAKILGDAAGVGFSQVAFLTAILSINLGIMNLIPFPALDGGQILVVLLEKISGKRLPAKAQGIVSLVGFSLLILLMIVVSVKDVSGLFG